MNEPIRRLEPQLQQRKAWWRSKTVWAGIGQTLAGLWSFGGDAVGLPAIPSSIGMALQILLGGGVLVGRKQAKGPLVASAKAETAP